MKRSRGECALDAAGSVYLGGAVVMVAPVDDPITGCIEGGIRNCADDVIVCSGQNERIDREKRRNRSAPRLSQTVSSPSRATCRPPAKARLRSRDSDHLPQSRSSPTHQS